MAYRYRAERNGFFRILYFRTMHFSLTLNSGNQQLSSLNDSAWNNYNTETIKTCFLHCQKNRITQNTDLVSQNILRKCLKVMVWYFKLLTYYLKNNEILSENNDLVSQNIENSSQSESV